MKKIKSSKEFIDHCIKNKLGVSVFLTNGVRLVGRITWRDLDLDVPCIGLLKDEDMQLVNLFQISSILPRVVNHGNNGNSFNN